MGLRDKRDSLSNPGFISYGFGRFGGYWIWTRWVVEARGQSGWLMVTDMEIKKIRSLSMFQLKYMKGVFLLLNNKLSNFSPE